MYDDLKTHAQELSTPLYGLNNDQALVVNDGQVELIGGGDKIII